MEQLIAFASLAVATNNHAGAAKALAKQLAIVWVAVAHAHEAAGLLGLVDVRAMDGVNAEDDDVAGFGWDGHCIF